MQDRYVGDIGDYVKLAILRAISPDYHVGVLWWRYPDEAHNLDGRHIGYLHDQGRWRSFDPDLFDSLKQIVSSDSRQVAILQSAGLLEHASHVDERIATMGTRAERRAARGEWFDRAQDLTRDCNILFLDPDNGLETKGFDTGAAKAGKSVALAELARLRSDGRTIIVYHHQHGCRVGTCLSLVIGASAYSMRGLPRSMP